MQYEQQSGLMMRHQGNVTLKRRRGFPAQGYQASFTHTQMFKDYRAAVVKTDFELEEDQCGQETKAIAPEVHDITYRVKVTWEFDCEAPRIIPCCCFIPSEQDRLQLSGLLGSSQVGLAVATVQYDSTKRQLALTADLEARSGRPGVLRCMLDPSALVLRPVTGSPISQQPVQTLALVCRFLTASDLIAVYQSNKLLSSAASHPLTFQNGCQTGLLDQLGEVTTYARGPSAEFSDPEKLKQAFSGRLFRHFHILRLVTSTHSATRMLENLAMERAPSLRSLHLCSYEDGNHLFEPSQFRLSKEVQYALRFVNHLHLQGPFHCIPSPISFLTSPLSSVELLHITFDFIPTKITPEGCTYVNEILQPNCSIRRVVYSKQPHVCARTSAATLLDWRWSPGSSKYIGRYPLN